MAEKFKKTRKFIIPTLLILVVAISIVCYAASPSELLKMLQNGDQIEIEVAEPVFAESEQGTEAEITWVELAHLTDNEVLRKAWDDKIGIIKTDIGKNGIFYVNESGENENNNTLAVVMHNREFQKILDSDSKSNDTLNNLADATAEQYADIEPSVEKTDIKNQVYIGINGYFSLLPDNEVSYANSNSTITRAEAMAMIFRADTPVQELTSNTGDNKSFEEVVGSNKLNDYAYECLLLGTL